jgi:hypothetical protein
MNLRVEFYRFTKSVFVKGVVAYAIRLSSLSFPFFLRAFQRFRVEGYGYLQPSCPNSCT